MTAVEAGQAGARRAFRSPVAVVIWWAWVVFAVANLIDLAVQGHDRPSLLAALGVLVVTGVVYAAAFRPRIVADADGLTIANPLRDHRVTWAAVTAIEAADLVRVRCEGAGGRRVIYAWAVHTSRLRQAAGRAGDGTGRGRLGGTPAPGAAGLRSRRVASAGVGSAGVGSAGMDSGSMGSGRMASPVQPRLDARQVVAALTGMARSGGAPLRDDGDRLDAPVSDGSLAAALVSRWQWVPVAAIAVPAVALVIAAVL